MAVHPLLSLDKLRAEETASDKSELTAAKSRTTSNTLLSARPVSQLLTRREFVFIPVPITPAMPAQVIEAVADLDEDLDLALDLVGEVAVCLRAALGESAVGPRLAAVAEAVSTCSVEALLSQVEAIVAAGEEGVAARQLRELVGVTWDEAYALRHHWLSMGVAHKRRWARRQAFRLAVRGANGPA
jgi:hypothetical protein